MTTPLPASPRVLTVATVDVSVAKFLRGFIEAQQEAGYAAEAACADGPYAAAMRADGLRVHTIPFTRRLLSWRHPVALVHLLRLLRRRRFDVVHVHNPVAQVLGRIAARLAGVPVIIYTSHGFQFHESRPPLARWAILQLERLLGRYATTELFTQSIEDAHTAVEQGIMPADRVVWIGNGVDLESFARPMDALRVRAGLGMSARDRVVGFVGRLVREKGIVELIEAMAAVRRAVPAVRLLVVGDTLASDRDSGAKAIVAAAIDRAGLSDAVVFAGFRDDIAELLSAMDVFTLPSWREGMPRSIIEAMASGLPVVATDIRGCREEVVAEQTGLLVPVKDAAALADALIRLLSEPALAARMGREGRRRAVEMFDERVVYARQLAVYEKLLAASGGVASLPVGDSR
ncbi:MAG TPA: glycosyltransferase family 4 protein [bacterium]|jgi:glycosyltransferase involved in cell wall biosynthesis